MEAPCSLRLFPVRTAAERREISRRSMVVFLVCTGIFLVSDHLKKPHIIDLGCCPAMTSPGSPRPCLLLPSSSSVEERGPKSNNGFSHSDRNPTSGERTTLYPWGGSFLPFATLPTCGDGDWRFCKFLLEPWNGQYCRISLKLRRPATSTTKAFSRTRLHQLSGSSVWS